LNTTSSLDLIRLGDKLGLSFDIISGDESQNIKKYRDLILNLGDRNTGGTHWTCFDAKNKIYVDSYGIRPDDDVLKQLKKLYGKIMFSNAQYQELNTESCGYFALYFLKELKTRPIMELHNELGDNPEVFLEQYFSEL
jgi:hypothetical protein